MKSNKTIASKQQVVRLLAEKTKITALKAREVLNATQECIFELAKTHDTVNLGQMRFKKIVRLARRSHNPKTGIVVDVPERKDLKLRVNKNRIKEIQ